MRAKYELANMDAEITVRITMPLRDWQAIGRGAACGGIDAERQFNNLPEPFRQLSMLAWNVAQDISERTSGRREAGPYFTGRDAEPDAKQEGST